MEVSKEMLNMVESDIQRISNSIIEGTADSRWELFRELDGRYQSCIKDFYKGMWQSVPGKDVLYFPRLKESPQYVLDNLKMVKAKLETYRFQANAVALPDIPQTNVNVTTNITISITFEEVRQKIQDMTSLTDEQTKEALEKINIIEKTVNSSDSKKSKWEQIKPVLVWLADKSFDVAMTIIPLLLKIQ